MKLVLEIQNGSQAIKPNKNNVILFNGKDWYVTTRQELFGEYENLIDKKIELLMAENEKLKEENANFKKEISKNISDISKVVKKLYEEK